MVDFWTVFSACFWAELAFDVARAVIVLLFLFLVGAYSLWKDRWWLK